MSLLGESSTNLPDQLTQFLNKLAHGLFKGLDEYYSDKLLSSVSNCYASNYLTKTEIVAWLKENTLIWPLLSSNTTILTFLMRLCGMLVNDEPHFQSLLESEIVTHLLGSSQANHKVSAVRCSYLTVLCKLIHHESGREWLRQQATWQGAVDMAVGDASIYVRRQAKEFLQSFLGIVKDNIELSTEVTKRIISPLLKTNQEDPTLANEDKEVTLRLKLVNDLLDDCLTTEAANALPNLLISHFHFDILLRKWTDVCLNDSFLDKLVTSYGTLILTALPNDEPVNVEEIFDLYRELIKGKRVSAVLTLSRVCHVLWLRMGKRRPNADKRIGMHFFLIQMMPLLLSLHKMHTSSLLDQFVNNLLEKISDDTFRMGYNAREIIRDVNAKELVVKATQTAYEIMDFHHLMDRENVIVTFKTLAWILKKFVPSFTDPVDTEIKQAFALCESAAPLLSVILQATCTLLDVYKITWGEAVESFIMLKACQWLLENPNLSIKNVMLTMRLMSLTISRYMAPSLILLMDKIEGTSLNHSGPLLIKRLHDPHWEVRDSALEVVAVIADAAVDKYPVFQELLLKLEFGSTAVAMLEGDAEGYVRASAIHTISAMVPVNKLWDESLAPLQVDRIVQSVIRSDSEGIVRREAALLVTCLVRHKRLQPSAYDELFQTMASVTLNDLHWEVRVNSLSFWAEVINLELQKQGMVDGVFPPITFSCETKKIVTLTGKEVQARLLKMMERLSFLGCLNVLLGALQDDCDQEVVNKAQQVVDQLLEVLRLYHVLPIESPVTSNKRKYSMELKQCQTFAEDERETKTASMVSSEDVIESIVNSTDLHLLTGVVIGDSAGILPPGKHAIQNISPDAFLAFVQGIDLSTSRDVDPATDLMSLLDDILTLDCNCDHETVPDCY